MSDAITGLIRTWTPTAVGAALAWLLTLGIELDPTAQAGLITGLTAVVIAVYYALARLLESRWPWLGVLLGSTKQPTYPRSGEVDNSEPSPN